ncbi:MAG: hypothetical protein KIT43_15560 [Bauldia sp.]|nr:hypothetical protein [Bauldia sp.]
MTRRPHSGKVVAAFRAPTTEGAVPRLAAEIFGIPDVLLMEDQFFLAATMADWNGIGAATG